VPHKHFIALALAMSLATTAAAQEITIGVTMGTRGPGASFGVSYSNAFKLLPKTIGGQLVKFIIYEDKADAAEAAKNARKLVTEEKVDVLIGSVSLRPTTEVALWLRSPRGEEMTLTVLRASDTTTAST
jgi:branched-chain amino acid transport system substrate-binding protein